MRQNEIDRERINAETEKFFAGGGLLTEVPFGFSAFRADGKRKSHAEHIALIKKRDMSASLARKERS